MESVGSPVGSAALDSCLLYACRVHIAMAVRQAFLGRRSEKRTLTHYLPFMPHTTAEAVTLLNL